MRSSSCLRWTGRRSSFPGLVPGRRMHVSRLDTKNLHRALLGFLILVKLQWIMVFVIRSSSPPRMSLVFTKLNCMLAPLLFSVQFLSTTLYVRRILLRIQYCKFTYWIHVHIKEKKIYKNDLTFEYDGVFWQGEYDDFWPATWWTCAGMVMGLLLLSFFRRKKSIITLYS